MPEVAQTVVVIPPSLPVLARYGLELAEWWSMLFCQDGACAICQLVPATPPLRRVLSTVASQVRRGYVIQTLECGHEVSRKRSSKKRQKCGRCPLIARFNVDHEHVKGWAEMPAAERKLYVRGILCWLCNKLYAGRGITVHRARRLVIYLEVTEARIAVPDGRLLQVGRCIRCTGLFIESPDPGERARVYDQELGHRIHERCIGRAG